MLARLFSQTLWLCSFPISILCLLLALTLLPHTGARDLACWRMARLLQRGRGFLKLLPGYRWPACLPACIPCSCFLQSEDWKLVTPTVDKKFGNPTTNIQHIVFPFSKRPEAKPFKLLESKGISRECLRSPSLIAWTLDRGVQAWSKVPLGQAILYHHREEFRCCSQVLTEVWWHPQSLQRLDQCFSSGPKF